MDPGSLVLRLPPAAVAAAVRGFVARGHVRLRGIYPAATADALHRHLAQELEWWRAVNQGERTWDLGPASIAAMAGGGDAPLLAAVHEGAREGFQFLFDTVRVSEEPRERAARALLLDRLIDALNRPESLELLRRITGLADVRRVDGQATRYLPGHFLTAHDDGIAGKDRLAAYVLNLTPRWRTDWGGLLQFHDSEGDVTHGYRPAFNALHLFGVPQVHSVSLVAPFAGAPRYSVTGWLRR